MIFVDSQSLSETYGAIETKDLERPRRLLISLLQLAYSGEQAAALAYRGHWKSVKDPDERAHIQKIEAEEWHHRELVGGILKGLGAGPSRWKEFKTLVIGRVIGFLCHVSGWLAPMYMAGKLESRNIREYEHAAAHARACGRDDLVDCLLTMAEVEWDHESYFRSQTLKHPLGRRLPLWAAPPPRESIRQ
jgi:rubrerythrin